jgi:hypothetical protein
MTSGDSPTHSQLSDLPRFEPWLDVSAAARQLRAELKRRFGWTRQQVGVRIVRGSTYSEINLLIVAPGIRLRSVERVAKRFTRLTRSVNVNLCSDVYRSLAHEIASSLLYLPERGLEHFHPFPIGPFPFEVSHGPGPGFGHYTLRHVRRDAPFEAHELGAFLARRVIQSRQWTRLLTLAASKETHS